MDEPRRRASQLPPSPQIGPVIQRERKQRRLTLDQLAVRSGVSRSMLSQIERGEANPTFAVLWSLTRALEIDFSDLIGDAATAVERGPLEVLTTALTPEIRSADGRCRLRILSPPRYAGRVEWYAVELEPDGQLNSAPHTRGAFEHFTAWSAGIRVESGGVFAEIGAGETVRYAADVEHRISNVGPDPASGLLVLLYQ